MPRAMNNLANIATPATPASARILQRACACGQHTVAGSECAECKKKREAGMLQRAAANNAAVGDVPAIVHDVLRSPGQPLDAATRAFMEPHFGHDFSGVRLRLATQVARSGLTLGAPADAYEREAERVASSVARDRNPAGPSAYDFGVVRLHTDAQAAESARSVNALAYTVGDHIVFGSGQYAPRSHSGRNLLAHELAHVVQQRGSTGAMVQRRGGTFGGFFSDLGRSFVEFFGAEVGFSEETLQAYLKILDSGQIEDNFDSDDKARAIIKAWRLGGSNFALTAQRKALLIKELQSGFTGDDDEQMVLELLERSYNYELTIIFGPGGVNVGELNDDFHGTEWQRLESFYERRFEGGMAAVLKGQIQPRDVAAPLGSDVQRMSDILADELPGAVGEWNIPCTLGLLCSMDRDVVGQLPRFTIKRIDHILVTRWTYNGTEWTSSVLQAKGMAESGGATGSELIALTSNKSCDSVSQTLVHEVRHLHQSAGETRYQREVDAYTFAESWAIARGLPGRTGLRRVDSTTSEQVPDPGKIDTLVREKYGSPSDTPGEEVVGRTPSGQAVVKRPNGSRYTRQPQQGDVYLDNPPQLIGEQTIPSSAWKCPPALSGEPSGKQEKS